MNDYAKSYKDIYDFTKDQFNHEKGQMNKLFQIKPDAFADVNDLQVNLHDLAK